MIIINSIIIVINMISGMIIIRSIVVFMINLMIRKQKQFTSGSVEWDFSDGDGSTTPPSPPNCSDTTQVIGMMMVRIREDYLDQIQ